MDWVKQAAKSILPQSEESHDLKKALQEWHYTGIVIDLEVAVETCQLCGHPDIRYQFEITNDQTSSTLLIGSECIKRFDIAAIDDGGNVLEPIRITPPTMTHEKYPARRLRVGGQGGPRIPGL